MDLLRFTSTYMTFRVHMDLHVFEWICMDLHLFGEHFNDFCSWRSGGLWPVAVPCGCLWQPVAACGSLWQLVAESCGPYTNTMLAPGSWQDAGWLAGLMAGWLDGGGRQHHFNLARSTPRRVGGCL